MGRAMLGRDAPALMLIGLRGTGKTVLLNRIAEFAEVAGMLTLFVEAPEGKDFARQFAAGAKTALTRLSMMEGAKEAARKGLGVLASFISSVKLSYGEISVSVDPLPGYADSGNLDADMTELMLKIGEAAGRPGRAGRFSSTRFSISTRQDCRLW